MLAATDSIGLPKTCHFQRFRAKEIQTVPFVGVPLVVIDAVLVLHAARSGRFYPWAYVILMLPGFGAAGYFLLILLP